MGRFASLSAWMASLAVAIAAAAPLPKTTVGFTLTATPQPVDFGPAVNGTSKTMTVSFSSPVPISGFYLTNTVVVSGTAFQATPSCIVDAEISTRCTVEMTFTPTGTGPASGIIDLVFCPQQFFCGSTIVPVSGVGAESLLPHYYDAILQRAPDPSGGAFWNGEISRLQTLNLDVNEAWYAMATTFFASPEYQAFARDDAGFIADLYETFFLRAPDPSGNAYWSSQLAGGLPRGVALVSFMLSPEFQSFTQGLYGAPRAPDQREVMVDLYRGALARLPDRDGMSTWTRYIATARCDAAMAGHMGPVFEALQNVSFAFLNSAEYLGRQRTDADYVADLYNAFLRRGGDLAGVQHWTDQLQGGASRESLRQSFFASAEFSARMSTALSPTCVGPP